MPNLKKEYKIFGLNVIARHDYNERNKEIESLIDKSIEYFLKYFYKYHKDGVILDIGSAYGYAVMRFRQKGLSAIGIDLFPVSLIKGVKVLKMDWNNIDIEFKHNYFSGIFFNHGIEHCGCAYCMLEKIKKVTKKNGIVFLAVPHGEDKWAWDLSESTTHFSLFTPPFLKTAVSRFFKVLDMKVVDLRGNPNDRRREIWIVGKKEQ